MKPVWQCNGTEVPTGLIPAYLRANSVLNSWVRGCFAEIYGTWTDPEAPKEWFCIAMENLCLENDLLTQMVGTSWDQTVDIMRLVAPMHGKNWNSNLREHEWLNASSER